MENDAIKLVGKDNEVIEPKVEFRMTSDRMWYTIVSEDPNVKEPYAAISGYDLRFNFNFKLINSLEDVETVVGGIADVFRDMLLSELFKQKKEAK